MFSSLGIYRRLIAIRIRSQMQYRISFTTEVITTALVSSLSYLTVALVLDRFNGIAGWSLGEVTFLFGMVETAFGVMDLVFSGFDPLFFGNHVRLGTFDQLLMRPVNITLQVLGSEFVLRRLGRIVQGMLIFTLALNLVDIQWTISKLVYLPIVFLSMIFFFGGLFVAGAAITFWTIESIEIVNIFTYGGSEMISYPMHIYPNWMVRFFTFIIPAIFLNYYPAIYFLDKPDPLMLPSYAPFLAPLAGLGTLIAGLTFWRFGIRHYQSTGT